MVTSIAISPEEHRARCDALLERVVGEELSASSSSTRTTSSTTPASRSRRPSGRSRSSSAADGERALVVPRLEVEHARGEGDVRPRRALPRVPGRAARGGRAIERALVRARPEREDRRRPGRLPVDPRLPRPDAQRALGRNCRAGRRPDRGADGGQVRGRDRAHPRERAAGGTSRIAAPALHAPGRHRDRGRSSARANGGDVRDARRDRRDLPRAELHRARRARRLPRPDRAQLRDPARARREHRVPGRATCS